MIRGIGAALLAAGIAAIIYGINMSNSVSSNVSKTFTGAPTDESLWFLIGGIAGAIVGIALVFRPSRKKI
ncbi:MAG: DUF3185 family protein [Limisphaerales bacterium]